MYKKKNILVVIPARGGSKGLPRKNILKLCKKPLIAWTIEAARKSRYVDRAVVSTDDPEIAKISRRHKAEVPFMRPKELARDNSSTIDAMMHAVDHFAERGEKFDYLALLEPTSPLRSENDIDKGMKKLIDNEDHADSLVSVGKIALEHPLIAKKIDKKGYVTPFSGRKEPLVTRRQEARDTYFPYGVIYSSKINTLRKFRTFYQKKTIPYFIERWQNYEIDDIYDFKCVETILEGRQKEKI